MKKLSPEAILALGAGTMVGFMLFGLYGLHGPVLPAYPGMLLACRDFGGIGALVLAGLAIFTYKTRPK